MEKGKNYFKGKNVKGTYLLCNQTNCKVKHVVFKWIWKDKVKDHIIKTRYSCWLLEEVNRHYICTVPMLTYLARAFEQIQPWLIALQLAETLVIEVFSV